MQATKLRKKPLPVVSEHCRKSTNFHTKLVSYPSSAPFKRNLLIETFDGRGDKRDTHRPQKAENGYNILVET